MHRQSIPRGGAQEEQTDHIYALPSQLDFEEKVFILSGRGFFGQMVADEMRFCASL